MSILSWLSSLGIINSHVYIYIQITSSVERENGEMDEEEHEVYGGEIPDEGEMEGDMDAHNADVDMATNDDDAVKVLSLYLHSFFQF